MHNSYYLKQNKLDLFLQSLSQDITDIGFSTLMALLQKAAHAVCDPAMPVVAKHGPFTLQRLKKPAVAARTPDKRCLNDIGVRHRPPPQALNDSYTLQHFELNFGDQSFQIDRLARLNAAAKTLMPLDSFAVVPSAHLDEKMTRFLNVHAAPRHKPPYHALARDPLEALMQFHLWRP